MWVDKTCVDVIRVALRVTNTDVIHLCCIADGLA